MVPSYGIKLLVICDERVSVDSDGKETIQLYHVDGLNHSDNMLIAYLPKEKIVVSATASKVALMDKRSGRWGIARSC